MRATRSRSAPIPAGLHGGARGVGAAGIAYHVGGVDHDPQEHGGPGRIRRQETLRLLDALEDSDDVQEVYANFDIPDDIMEALAL